MRKKCQHCPNEFESNRWDSKYCSNSCRVKASVARKQGSENNFHYPTTPNAIRNNPTEVQTLNDNNSALFGKPIYSFQKNSNIQRMSFVEKELVSTSIGLIGKYIEKNHLDNKPSLNDNLNRLNEPRTLQNYFLENGSIWGAIGGGVIGYIYSDTNRTSNLITGAIIGGGIGYLITSAVKYFSTPEVLPTYQHQILPNQKLLPTTMSTNQLADQVFDTYNFSNSALLKDFIGEKPDKQFQMVLFGLPKTGKSTLSLYLARQLARFGKVLYVAAEEGLTETFRERIVRLGVKHENIIVTAAKDLETIIQLGNTVNFVVLDSLSILSKQEDSTLSTIRQHLPHVATISILQSTKDGGHKGSQGLLHDTGIIVNTTGDGKATVQSRYKSSTGEYSFDEIADIQRNNPQIIQLSTFK